MTLAEKQREIATALDRCGNASARLSWLVEHARQYPDIEPGLRVEANLVPGCLSRLWLVCES